MDLILYKKIQLDKQKPIWLHKKLFTSDTTLENPTAALYLDLNQALAVCAMPLEFYAEGQFTLKKPNRSKLT